MNDFIEWVKLPRGTYRCKIDNFTADVWSVGGKIWKWNVLESGIKYVGTGIESSLDFACEAAVKFMETY